MPRHPRLDPTAGWHHVMNRGANRHQIFFGDSDRVEFGQRLAAIDERFGVEVHAYCLMGNHYHLVVHCPQAGLSPAMQHVGSVFTRHVNDRCGRDGPLFRGRFASRLIEDEGYLMSAVRYVHRNPLDLPTCRSIDAYRWSSHRTYLGHRRRPPWLHVDRVLELFGGDVAAYERFMSDGETTSAVRPQDTAAFVEAAQLVIAELGLVEEARGRSLARALVLAACDSTENVHAAATALGIMTPGAIRTALSRARAITRDNPHLAAAAGRAADLLHHVSDT